MSSSTVYWQSTFEVNNFTEWTSELDAQTHLNVSSAQAHSGTYSAAFIADSNADMVLYKTLAADQSNATLSFWLYQNDTVNDTSSFYIRNRANDHCFLVMFSYTTSYHRVKIRAYIDAGTYSDTSVYAFQAGATPAWHNIKIVLKTAGVGANDGTCELIIDGASQQTLTGLDNDACGKIGKLELEWYNSGINRFLDDVQVLIGTDASTALTGRSVTSSIEDVEAAGGGGAGVNDEAEPDGVTTGAGAAGTPIAKATSSKTLTGISLTPLTGLWDIGAYVYRTVVTATASSKITLTGVAATASVGSLVMVSSASIVITGREIASARGTIIPSAGARAPPTGVSSTSVVGSGAGSGTAITTVSGIAIISAVKASVAICGSSVPITGRESTSAKQGPSPLADSNVPVTGLDATSGFGSSYGGGGGSAPGQEVVSSIGTPVATASSSVLLTGQTGTSGFTIANGGGGIGLAGRSCTSGFALPYGGGGAGLTGRSLTGSIYPVMPGSGFNRVGSATRTTFTATVSPALNFPTGVAADDLLVAFIGSSTTYTLSSTTGWNLIGTKQNAAGTDSSYTLLWRYHTSGSSWTFTNLFTSSQVGAGVIVAWNKTNTGTTPIHKYAQAASAIGATSLSGPSLTTVSTPNCLIVQFAGCDPQSGTYAGTPDSSPVAQELYDSKDAGNNTYIFIQSYLLTNPAAIALDVTGLTADNYAYFQIAIMAPFPFVTGLTLTVGRTPPVAKAGSSPPATTRLATGSVGAPRGGGGHGPLGRYSTAAVGTVVAVGAYDGYATVSGRSASASVTVPARSGTAVVSITEQHGTASIGTVTAVGGADGYATVTGQYATSAREAFTATSSSAAQPVGLQLTLSRGLLVKSGAAETLPAGVEATAGNGTVATGPLLVGRSATASSGSINIWPILQGQDVTGSIGSPLWTLLFSGVNATFWFGYPVASIIGIQAEALPVGVFATAKANPPFGILSLWEVGAYVYIPGLPGTADASVAASTRLLTTGRGIPVAKSGAKAAPEGVSSTAARGAVGVIGSNNVLLLGRSCSSGCGAVVGSSAPAAAVGGVSATGSVGPFVHTSAWDVGAYIYGSGVVYGSANIPIAGLQVTASKGAFGAAPVGVFAAASIGHIATIEHISGVQATSAVGTVQVAQSLGSNSATSAIGAVLAAAGPQVLLTGVEASGDVGALSVGIDIVVAIAGVEATSEVPAKGQIDFVISSSVGITGVETVSSVGDLIRSGDAETSITGVEATGEVSEVATAQAILGVDIACGFGGLVFGPVVTGVTATGAVGIAAISTDTLLVGVETEAGRGAVTASTAPTYGQGFADGQEVVSSFGTLSWIGNATRGLTGVGSTSSVSIPTVSSTTGVIPAGLQLTLTLGPIAAGQVLAGVSATGSRGTIRPTVHIDGLELTSALGTIVRSGDAIRGITGVYCTAARTVPRADVAFEVEGVTAAGYADNLPASGDARITLDAVNVQATAYIGDIIATGTILGEAAVLGKSAAASVGTVRGTAGSVVAIDGVEEASAIGEVILGVGMTVALTGLYATSAKPADLVAASDASVALIGRSATAILGPMSGLAGGSAFILISTGVEVTAACGDVIASCNVSPALIGRSVTASPGSVLGSTPGVSAASGREIVGSVGTVTAVGWTAADGIVPIAGVSTTSGKGGLSFSYGVQALPEGITLTTGFDAPVADVIGIRKNGDTYTEAFTTPATTFTTGAITVAAGRNSVMVVSIVVNSTGTLTNPCITAIKWGGSGGVALTRAGYVPNDHSRETGLWYLVAPTVQTSTLYVTTADSVACSLVMSVFDHASQYGNPFRSVNTTTGYSKSAQVSVYAQPGDLLIDAFMGGSTQTVTCMQTLDGSVTNSASLASRCAMSHAGMN